ncbi:ATP-binding protein [Poseidonocella pacifica]|uniref:ATP-binding protein n=1 Tax=Poseidonocella pacifica TaxID=871651 RepID=UPI0015870912|nr:ATP-binding protein [Poseidonocella pacifica]
MNFSLKLGAFVRGLSLYARVDGKMATALRDRVAHHCAIIETGNSSYRFAQSKSRIEK